MKLDRQIVHRTQANWLQRSAVCWLRLGQHLAKDEKLRRWAIHNARIGAWLFIPAIFVLPAIGLILWQVTGWYDMLDGLFGHVIGLPILVLIVLLIFRNLTAFYKR